MRYEVGYIWKNPATTLPSKGVVAERCLELLGNAFKLTRTKNKYHESVENDLRMEYIKTLIEEDFSKPVAHKWYLHIIPTRMVRLAAGTGEALRILGVITV